jgi:hypothetical protein
VQKSDLFLSKYAKGKYTKEVKEIRKNSENQTKKGKGERNT